MLDHLAIKVSNYDASRAFYLAALSPLGYELVMEHEISGVGLGQSGKPNFWIQKGEPSGSIHIAFGAADRVAVDAFYEAAIAAGGSDHGPPGLRSQYHPTYYGAFVIDLDGNNVEAVCHRGE